MFPLGHVLFQVSIKEATRDFAVFDQGIVASAGTLYKTGGIQQITQKIIDCCYPGTQWLHRHVHAFHCTCRHVSKVEVTCSVIQTHLGSHRSQNTSLLLFTACLLMPRHCLLKANSSILPAYCDIIIQTPISHKATVPVCSTTTAFCIKFEQLIGYVNYWYL